MGLLKYKPHSLMFPSIMSYSRLLKVATFDVPNWFCCLKLVFLICIPFKMALLNYKTFSSLFLCILSSSRSGRLMHLMFPTDFVGVSWFYWFKSPKKWSFKVGIKKVIFSFYDVPFKVATFDVPVRFSQIYTLLLIWQ